MAEKELLKKQLQDFFTRNPYYSEIVKKIAEDILNKFCNDNLEIKKEYVVSLLEEEINTFLKTNDFANLKNIFEAEFSIHLYGYKNRSNSIGFITTI